MKSADSAPTGLSPMQVRVRLSPAVSQYTGDSVWLKNGPVWCGVGGGGGGGVGVGVWCVGGGGMLTLSKIVNTNFQCSFPINIFVIKYIHMM